MDLRIPIIECFGPTIQGEGIMTGTTTNFLRTGGCGYKCTWCDSLYAVTPSEVLRNRTLMETHEILSIVEKLGWAPYLTLTGGDPCIHEKLGEIIFALQYKNTRVAVETQGQFYPDWLMECDVITFSPKGPSSGNVTFTPFLIDWLTTNRPLFKGRICIKVVIFDPHGPPKEAYDPQLPPLTDMEYAMRLYESLPHSLYDAFYFTAGSPPWDPEAIPTGRALEVLSNQADLADALLNWSRNVPFDFKTHVGCQQHVLLWPHKEKGV